METALFVSNVILDSILFLFFLVIVCVFVLEIKCSKKKTCPKRCHKK